jgi:hypothetical protein
MTEANATENQAQAQQQEAIPTVGGRKIIAVRPLEVDVEHLFKFRKTKDKETGVVTERANIVLNVPVPSVDGIINIIENADTRPKEFEFLMSLIHDGVISSIKDALGDDTSLTVENFPLSKFTFAELANAPESERGSRGLDKDLLAAFLEDYIAIMPAASGKDAKIVEKQAAVIGSKFATLRNHAQKDLLVAGFQKSLALYVEKTENLEDFASVVEYLTKRLDTLAKAEVSLTDALGF